MNKLSDQWQTPQWLFDELNAEFNFDIDLCSTRENSKCLSHCIDYLRCYFTSHNQFYDPILACNLVYPLNTAFMNPPYSNPLPFIEKAWEDSKHCKIVCLLKVDPSTKWWSVFWNYEEVKKDIEVLTKGPIQDTITDKGASCSFYSRETQTKIIEKIGPKPGCEIRFGKKRIQFDPPQQLIDSGEVWKVKDKWVIKCDSKALCGHRVDVKQCGGNSCRDCKGKGYKTLSGPSFASCVVIFDRRGL